jgi:hypothetical protein
VIEADFCPIGAPARLAGLGAVVTAGTSPAAGLVPDGVDLWGPIGVANLCDSARKPRRCCTSVRSFWNGGNQAWRTLQPTGQRKVESSTLTNSSKSRDHGAEQLFQVILRLLEVIILTGAPSTALPLGAAILKIFVSPWNRNLPFCVWSSDAVGRIVDIFAVAPDDLKRQQKLRGADAEDSASNTVGSVNTLVVAQQQVGKRIRGHVCALQSVNDKVIGGPECSLIGCSALGRLLLHCFFLDDFGRGTGIRGQAVNLALPGAAPCRASFGGSERRLSSPATHRGQIASSFDTDSCRNPGWIPALSKR